MPGAPAEVTTATIQTPMSVVRKLRAMSLESPYTLRHCRASASAGLRLSVHLGEHVAYGERVWGDLRGAVHVIARGRGVTAIERHPRFQQQSVDASLVVREQLVDHRLRLRMLAAVVQDRRHAPLCRATVVFGRYLLQH